jgi:predicted phosphoribosyltransferase
MRRFTDRTEAGRELAATLDAFRGRTDVVVLALPRGGVPVAFEVAKALGAPMDVFTVRKLGAPTNEEFAIGAIATGGITVIDWHAVRVLDVSERELQMVVTREAAELARRERLYRGDRVAPAVAGRTVVVIDDGLATGATMQAAVAAIRTLRPVRIVVAAPVGSREACAAVRRVADACLTVSTPHPFFGVGYWYDDFSQTSDAEVLELLRRAAPNGAVSAPVRRSA